MASFLTPLQLQAGAGLLQNQGLQVATELTDSVSDYTSLDLLVPLLLTIGNVDLLPSTLANLQTFASNSCPALADSIPIAFISNVGNTVNTTFVVASPTQSDPGMTGMITLTAEAYLGNGDLSKFAQTFNTAVGYADTTNIFINSAVNANTYLGGTFTSIDNLITGGLTDVNLATQAMGDDLYNAGYWINLDNLDNLGSPLALIQQISLQAGTISPLIGPLSDAGVNENITLNLSDTDLIVTDDVQKVMYQTLTKITGTELNQILQILGIWTPNINTLADLLNPAVMLPNSYSTLTTTTADGLRGIYITAEPSTVIERSSISNTDFQTILDQEAETRVVERPMACEIRQSENPGVVASSFTNNSVTISNPTTGNTGTGAAYTVNSNLEGKIANHGMSYERLSIITTPGLALANKAFSNALCQVTNISRMTTPQLSDAFLAVETNTDLDDIEAQTQAVPQTDLDYYKNTYATGSGDNGTILITDILGTAVGTNITENLNNCVSIINSLYNAGELTDLITIYNDMYGNVAVDATILTLIGDAQTEINNIIAANPTETTNLNTYFSAISTQLTKEAGFQTTAAIDITNVISSQTSTQSFIFSLPSYGLDTKVGGTAQYLEDIAVISGAGNIVITNQGSTYSNANNVPTTGGLGTGLTVNITQTTGIIDTAVINHPGEGYAVSDVVTISGGTATVEVTSLNTSGQAIVATLREGRSKLGLSGSGVGTASNVVPADPNEIPPQAPLIPSIVSESSARAGVVY